MSGSFASMKIAYRNTVRDQLAFAAYHFPRSPMMLFMTIGFLLLTSYLSVIPGIPKDKSLAFQISYLLFCEVVLVFFIVVFCTVIVLAGIISRKNKPLVAERTVSFGEDSFISESSYARSEYRWPMVQKLGRTRNHAFLYFNKNAAMIVPRRAFENASQWDEFYEFCKSKMRTDV
jgi:hypothetical protein